MLDNIEFVSMYHSNTVVLMFGGVVIYWLEHQTCDHRLVSGHLLRYNNSGHVIFSFMQTACHQTVSFGSIGQ